MENKTSFVNTPIDKDLLEKVDIMAQKQENTRAGIVRLALRQLWEDFQRAENLKSRILGKTPTK